MILIRLNTASRTYYLVYMHCNCLLTIVYVIDSFLYKCIWSDVEIRASNLPHQQFEVFISMSGKWADTFYSYQRLIIFTPLNKGSLKCRSLKQIFQLNIGKIDTPLGPDGMERTFYIIALYFMLLFVLCCTCVDCHGAPLMRQLHSSGTIQCLLSWLLPELFLFSTTVVATACSCVHSYQ